MLTASELAAMRATVEDTLSATAQIQRPTLDADGAGGFIVSWAPVATVACRIAPGGRSSQERVIAERLTATGLWVITLPALTDVRPTDRIIVGLRTFEAVAILAHSDEISCRVICTEVL